MQRNGAVPALACVGVVKRFGDVCAVDGLDLTIARGGITALLGPSGCGKTTALRLVAGLDQPDAGAIHIDGRLVAGSGGGVAPERRNVGMVFQDYALFPHLTVEANVAYGLRRLARDERARRVAATLELVGMPHLRRRLPAALSGGQQQRVALARALAPAPDLVLLDEPFSNLDARLRAGVRAEVRAILRAAGTTAVFVTHDQEEALSLADAVAVMSAGRVDQVADPHTLYTRPASRFVAEFVGDADLLAANRVGEQAVDTVVGRLTTLAPVATAATTVVLRPEALHLEPRPDGAAVVEAVTFYGHDQLVHLRLPDGTALRSRRGPELILVAGDRVDVRVAGPVVAFDGQGVPAPA